MVDRLSKTGFSFSVLSHPAFLHGKRLGDVVVVMVSQKTSSPDMLFVTSASSTDAAIIVDHMNEKQQDNQPSTDSRRFLSLFSLHH